MIRVENPYPDTVVVPMVQDMPSMRTMMHRAFDAGAKAQLKKVVEILGAYKVDIGREDKVPMIYLRLLELDWQALLDEVKNDKTR